MAAPILEMKHITKIFPGVKALDGVSFDLRAGEIHAIVGENGAGKSTFIKVLTGVHQPDGGEIILDGKPLVMANPNIAIQHGIAAIYQHAASYPDLSVAENIFIGHEFRTGPFISWVKARKEAQKLLDSIGANFSPNASVGALSVAQQQMVEIAKALSQNARILIMDEPTAALSKKESEELYSIARSLRDKGVAIILISHRFEDIFGLADRCTVFRDAHYIGTWGIDEVDESLLVHHMVGHVIEHYYPERTPHPGDEVLRVEKLSRTGYFRDVSFSLRAGEIVGLTGLVGAGRTEVVEALCGVTGFDSGKVIVEGREQKYKDPKDSMAGGIGLLPEDRQKQGLLLPWSISKNITLPIIDKCTRARLFMSGKAEKTISNKEKEQLAIKAPDVETAAGTLSGGNQQKVVIAKQLAASSRIIILDEPTKGVDIGSKAAIYELMAELAAQGVAILMISSEMPEVMNMSDRIYVMSEGHVTKEFTDVKNLTQQQILEAAMPQERTA
ncbi:MAG: sugar ABC transporter ATP-binding protein [Clostridia bacterium]|jgi:ABC-type sugar transport system, ATPase component|nr:sugar ABC transporter ATP-binding protein [Clostridia bacterium]